LIVGDVAAEIKTRPEAGESKAIVVEAMMEVAERHVRAAAMEEHVRAAAMEHVGTAAAVEAEHRRRRRCGADDYEGRRESERAAKHDSA
jgi:hypothetical protein